MLHNTRQPFQALFLSLPHIRNNRSRDHRRYHHLILKPLSNHHHQYHPSELIILHNHRFIHPVHYHRLHRSLDLARWLHFHHQHQRCLLSCMILIRYNLHPLKICQASVAILADLVNVVQLSDLICVRIAVRRFRSQCYRFLRIRMFNHNHLI